MHIIKLSDATIYSRWIERWIEMIEVCVYVCVCVCVCVRCVCVGEVVSPILRKDLPCSNGNLRHVVLHRCQRHPRSLRTKPLTLSPSYRLSLLLLLQARLTCMQIKGTRVLARQRPAGSRKEYTKAQLLSVSARRHSYSKPFRSRANLNSSHHQHRHK